MSADSYIQELVNELGADDEAVRADAIRALGEAGAEGGVAVPILAITLRHSELKCYATLALGGIGPAAAPAVPELIRTLADYNVVVRWSAANALADIGPAAAEAVPQLAHAVKSTHAVFRCMTTDERKGIGPMEVRCAAARALGCIGAAANTAIVDLEMAAVRAGRALREEIEKAIARIQNS